MAMEISSLRRCHLPLLLLFMLAGSSMALPVQPAMDQMRWQVNKVNQRGPSIGLVMSYIDEATALQSSGYFRPRHVLPFVDLFVYELKGSSADMFLDNAEYRKLLFKEFGVSTVAEESAAVVTTTTSPGIPVIVFRGVSDLVGGEPTWSSTSLMILPSINALKVAVEFIATVGKQKSTTSAGSANN